MTPVASTVLRRRMTDATQLSYLTASIQEVNVHDVGLGANILPLETRERPRIGHLARPSLHFYHLFLMGHK